MYSSVFEQIWIVVERRQHLLNDVLFCSKFRIFVIIFSAAHFMSKKFIKISWHELNDMATSSATSLIVIRQLFKIIFFTASMFSSVVDVLGRSGRASSLTSSQFSLSRLYHNWTCVLLIVDLPNATVNISFQFVMLNNQHFHWTC